MVEIKGVYLSDDRNEDALSYPVLPILFDNIRAELSKNALFLLEMKVNPGNVDPEQLDPNKSELSQVKKTFETLEFEISFNLFEYKDNKDFVSQKFDG